jgi:hypothetical protein
VTINQIEPIEPVAVPTEPTRRRTVRPWHIVVLLVGALALAGAVVFTMTASSDRDDATASRHRAEHQLRFERGVLHRARADLAEERAIAGHVAEPMAPVLTSAQGLIDLAGRALTQARTMHSVGATDDAPDDDYNAAVDRANEIATQYNAMADALRQQLDALVEGDSSQVA